MNIMLDIYNGVGWVVCYGGKDATCLREMKIISLVRDSPSIHLSYDQSSEAQQNPC